MVCAPHRRPQARLQRRASALIAGGALLLLGACSQSENAQVKADAQDAAAQAGAGLNRAAVGTKAAVDDTMADAKPAVDKAARDAKRGVDSLAIAAGKATQKAGATLEGAGERHRQAGDSASQ